MSFTDNDGIFLIFPVKGGAFNAANKKIRKHERTPTATAQRVFIKACRNEDGSPTFTTTPRPAQLMYEASVKFVELGDRYRLPVRGTREYTELQQRISKSLRETEISKVEGFEDVVVTKFKSTDKQFGEFEAQMIVIVDQKAYEAKEAATPTVEEAILDTFSEGRVGALKVEPDSLVVKAPVVSEPSAPEDGDADGETFLTSTKLYIVVACIAALVFVALVQASCTIYKMCKKSRQVKFCLTLYGG